MEGRLIVSMTVVSRGCIAKRLALETVRRHADDMIAFRSSWRTNHADRIF